MTTKQPTNTMLSPARNSAALNIGWNDAPQDFDQDVSELSTAPRSNDFTKIPPASMMPRACSDSMASIRSIDSGYVSDCIATSSKTSYCAQQHVYPNSAAIPQQHARTAAFPMSNMVKVFSPISSPSAPLLSAISSTSSSAKNTSVKTSRELVFELWGILQEQDEDKNAYPALDTDDGIEHWAHGVGSPRTATTGSRTSNSPKSSTTSTSISFGDVNKTNTWAIKRGFEDKDEDEGASRKKSKDDQDNFAMESLQQPNYQGQMTCPLLESHECQGTNTTISELLRSLLHRHRIVICKECCERIMIEDEEKKPANVLKKHATGCQRRCIGSSCVDGLDGNASHHRRTEGCPSWATLAKEARWTFIWTLVNPESTPPDPVFLPGPAFEHSQEKRLCKQQARARGNEICAHLLRDIEAKEKRITTLEKDIVVAKTDLHRVTVSWTSCLTTLERESQMAKKEIELVQERCHEKVVNLENIIENLLERLNENGCFVPGSLQKRLHNECPTVMAEVSAAFPTSCLQANPQSLPATAFPSWMASSTPNAIFPAPLPPPPLCSTPNISTWRGINSQPGIGSNTGSHYSPLYPVTTTSAMDQVNPYTSIWSPYQQQAYPPQHPDYPSQHPGYPPQQPGYPLQQQSQSYDEQQQCYAVGGEAVGSDASENERDSTR